MNCTHGLPAANCAQCGSGGTGIVLRKRTDAERADYMTVTVASLIADRARLRGLLERAKDLLGSAYWKCNGDGACSGCANESERDYLIEEIAAAIKETK